MNCYAGLAKRIVKSCFPQVVPVPQLEPLDASKIIKQEACIALSNVSQNKLVNQQTYWTHERLFNPKPITDEEVWAATLTWAEAKAQEREAEALKASSQTETDESYDSDDSKVGTPIQPVRKSSLFDGDVYEGEYKASKMDGRGIYRFSNGDVYEGEFKTDKREGHGKYVWASGAIYEGEYKTDKMDGRGIYRLSNGDVYEGEFKTDKREGRGILR